MLHPWTSLHLRFTPEKTGVSAAQCVHGAARSGVSSCNAGTRLAIAHSWPPAPSPEVPARRPPPRKPSGTRGLRAPEATLTTPTHRPPGHSGMGGRLTSRLRSVQGWGWVTETRSLGPPLGRAPSGGGGQHLGARGRPSGIGTPPPRGGPGQDLALRSAAAAEPAEHVA